MSVFRPVNSAESNLFTIRLIVDFDLQSSGSLISPSIVVRGPLPSSVTTSTADNNLLLTPTSNNLPEYFSILHEGDIFYLIYGKYFTTQPCISITPRLRNISTDNDNASIIPCISYQNNNNYYTNTPVVIEPNSSSEYYNVAFYFKQSTAGSTKLSLASTTGQLRGLDLTIIGPTKIGVTTGNSNKGWSVGSGSDPNNLYSYLNVGINTGNPTSHLHVNGRIDYFIKKSNTGSDLSSQFSNTLNAITTLPTTSYDLSSTSNINYFFFGTLLISDTSDVTITFPTYSNISTYMNQLHAHTLQTFDTFDITIINQMAANTITITADSTGTLYGCNIIYQNNSTSSSYTGPSVGNFRIIIDSSTTYKVIRL